MDRFFKELEDAEKFPLPVGVNHENELPFKLTNGGMANAGLVDHDDFCSISSIPLGLGPLGAQNRVVELEEEYLQPKPFLSDSLLTKSQQ